MLTVRYDDKDLRLMKHRGVPVHEVTGARNVFDIESSLTRIKPVELYVDVKFRSIGIKTQTRVLSKIIENPFRGYPVICISSVPTDHKAKILATSIFHSAMLKHRDVRRIRKLDMPLWYRLYGGYKNPIVDGLIQKPSLVVLSNITNDSTQLKLEKLRDILEKWNDITRIVLISGEDPITFFANKLKYPLKIGIYLKNNVPKTTSLLDI